MENTVERILMELSSLAGHIREEELNAVCDLLYEAAQSQKRIFLAGAGRSGCVLRAFANRLMHLGFTCHIAGDVTAPPIEKDEILFILSGSGKTGTLVKTAKKAKSLGARILTITLQPDEDIGQMADQSILLPGTTRLKDHNSFDSIQPIGSSFEQLSWLTCDGIIMLLKERLHQTNEDLIKRHGNLE
ncbi:MAG: SIS domain-containing protein [Lacrimispora sp.]|uniref:6-phospho-3-hexuloisomerase n=1 Tax=Lacrimispora sp. TaxID=2719234 RepID=UPI0039E650AF